MRKFRQYNLTYRILICIYLFIALRRANADEASLQNTRTTAVGNTGYASATGTTALYRNPAGMATVKSFAFQSLYRYDAKKEGHTTSIGGADSRTGKMAGGVYYTYQKIGEFAFDNNLASLYPGSSHRAAIVLAAAMGDRLSLGFTGRYSWYSLDTDSLPVLNMATDGTSLNGNDALSQKKNGFDLDIGSLFRVYKQILFVGVVGENILQLDELIAPRALGVGASIHLKSRFNINYDMRFAFANDQRKFEMSYRGGIEAFFQRMYAIRAGTFHDTRQNATYLSFGLGAYNTKYGIEGAMAQQLGGSNERLISFGIQLYMP